MRRREGSRTPGSGTTTSDILYTSYRRYDHHIRGEEGPGPRALALPPATYCTLHTAGTITTFEERGSKGGISLNFYGAQESILRNWFRQPMHPGGSVRQPFRARFLAPIDCSKIRALEPVPRNHHQQHILSFMQHSSSSTYCTASSRPFWSKEASAAYATHRKRE